MTDFKSTLSYSRADHAINRHCDEDDVSKQYIIDNLGRTHVDEDDKLSRGFIGSGQSRKMIVINESGLYSLVLSSKLQELKNLKDGLYQR